VDCLTSPASHKFFDRKVIEFVQTRKDGSALGNAMLKAGFFHRAEFMKKRHEFEEGTRLQSAPVQVFDEEGVYTWLIYPSQRRQYIQLVFLIILAIMVCLIKVWPLWLKIAVWWISLILLVTMTSIIIIRLILFILMWIIGFRGLWLFPNLFLDDTDLLDAFTPIFGRGIDTSVPISKKKKKETSEGTVSKDKMEANKSADTNPSENKQNNEPEGYYHFGLINLAIIIFLGVIICYQMGIFDRDNIPNFVASPNDLKGGYSALLLGSNEFNSSAESSDTSHSASADSADSAEYSESSDTEEHSESSYSA